jgi:Fe-S cluster assembly protein SufB
MPAETEPRVQDLIERDYQYGFVTPLDTDVAPKGLSEEVVRLISARKNEPAWLLEWRLGAFRHFVTLEPPTWPNVRFDPIDYQNMSYWAAPKPKGDAPKSLDEIDPEMREMFDKLGISLA